MPSIGFTSSNSRSRGGQTTGTHGGTGRHGRGTYYRSSSRNDDDEMKLQGMEHARGKEFGTLTSAWHPEDERDPEVGSNHSETMIINTKTSVYYHTEEEVRAEHRRQEQPPH